MLQDRIIENQNYFLGVSVAENYMVMKVKFPEKWGVFKSTNPPIEVSKSQEEGENVYIYYGLMAKVTVDDLFDLLEDTVKQNVEALRKIELLQKKFDELKDLFARENIHRLEKLQFVIPKNEVNELIPDLNGTEKKKRKYNKKKKEAATDELPSIPSLDDTLPPLPTEDDAPSQENVSEPMEDYYSQRDPSTLSWEEQMKLDKNREEMGLDEDEGGPEA
jgi:hypothetical protein